MPEIHSLCAVNCPACILYNCGPGLVMRVHSTRIDALNARESLFMTSGLFSGTKLRDLALENRIVVSPMCQYKSTNGTANDWHLVHIGGLAQDAAGLVIIGMTNVSLEGRISLRCATLCTDENEAALRRTVEFCRTYGVAKSGIQIGHAGRKGSQQPSAKGGAASTEAEGTWQTGGPSASMLHGPREQAQ